MQEMRDARDMDLIPGLGRSLEKEMATHSTILAWKIPWAEELGRLQFTVLQIRTQLSMHTHTHTHTHTQSLCNFDVIQYIDM